jgi:tetratricopeptide (TPR) repeat protein
VLEKAGGADPKLVAAVHWRRGVGQEARGQPALARADYDQALAHNPDFPEALSARGWLHFREDRIDAAFADFTEVIRVAPNDGRAYAQRAQAYIARGEWDRATADLTTGMEHEPGAVFLYVMRSQVHIQQGNQEEALADLSEAIRLEPDKPDGYVYRATLYGRQGAYARERADLDAALRINPEDVASCNLLAWHLATCPDPRWRDGARALTHARLACEKTDWKQPNFLDTLAPAYAENGQFDEACRWQEQALALFPESMDHTPYRARLETYRSGQPHREPPPPDNLSASPP